MYAPLNMDISQSCSSQYVHTVYIISTHTHAHTHKDLVPYLDPGQKGKGKEKSAFNYIGARMLYP